MIPLKLIPLDELHAYPVEPLMIPLIMVLVEQMTAFVAPVEIPLIVVFVQA